MIGMSGGGGGDVGGVAAAKSKRYEWKNSICGWMIDEMNTGLPAYSDTGYSDTL